VRIAIYHNQPPGGARRALHGFCRELSRRHHLDVYTLTTADQEMLSDAEVAASVTQLPYSRRQPVRLGLYWSDLQRRRDLDDLERVNAEAAHRIDASGYDAVLVDACRFTFAPYVLRYLRTPSAYYCHHRPRGPDEAAWLPPRTPYERARELVHRPLERRLEERLRREDAAMVCRASKVLTNSAVNQLRLREIYGVNAAVCPPGVEVPVSQPSEKGDYVLGVGALETHKGFDFMVEAVGRIPARMRPPLHIVTNGGSRAVLSQLASQADRMKVALRIRIRPSAEELGREYAQALAFLWASHQEPLGLAPLEAMAHGVPVVAVAEGGVLETVEDGRTGYLVDRDPAAFSERLRELLSAPQRREAMGRAGRALVQQEWTWPKRAAVLEKELEALALMGGRVAVGRRHEGRTHGSLTPRPVFGSRALHRRTGPRAGSPARD
jgi:glycosyltransferase involved in cell wall biosynthesis